MLKKGDRVDDFQAVDHNGESVKFSDMLAGGTVVMFFYPLAFSRGCTRQGCRFRDLRSEFAELGAQVVGVGGGSPQRLNQFREANNFGFTLLNDSDRELARMFGVSRWLKFLPKRATFVVTTDSIVLHVLHSETDMHSHADQALKVLKTQGKLS